MFGRRDRVGGGLVGGLSGVAAGAAMMWFLDPRRGAARRADVGQRAGRMVRGAEGLVEAGARDLSHRASGLVAEARARLRSEPVDDEVIAERVRARLGRLTTHSRAIEVAVRDGKVELSGRVLESEAPGVLVGVRMVRGVRGVEDRLERHASAEGVPDLQGGGRAAGLRPEFLQESWSPGARLVGVTAGSILLGRALFGSGLLRPVYGIVGGGLLARAIANVPVREAAERARRGATVAADRLEEAADAVSETAHRAADAASERAHRTAEQARRGARRARRAAETAKQKASEAAREAAEAAREKVERAKAKVEEVKSPAEGRAEGGEREERGERGAPEGGWKMSSGAGELGVQVEPLGAEGSVHAEPPLGSPGREVSPAAGVEPGPAWREPAFPTSPEPGVTGEDAVGGARTGPAEPNERGPAKREAKEEGGAPREDPSKGNP